MEGAAKEYYTVHEMCAKTGVTRKTLFYYARQGILMPAAYAGSQHQKLYDDTALRRLHMILQYKEAGLQLKEIRALLAGEAEHTEVYEEAEKRIRAQILRYEKQLMSLAELRKKDTV